MDKTKIMAWPGLAQDIVLSNGTAIQHVDEFKYIGSMMSSSAEDLRVRKAQAWAAFWSMSKICRSDEITLSLKLRIYDSTCLSVLLYGSEAWSLTSAMIKSINSFNYMLNIRWMDMVRNEEVLRLVGKSPLVSEVVRRQIGLLGHNMRNV